MLNFNNYKIGVLGWAGSGKTVLLTSLLWNLEEKQLKLGGEAPKCVKIDTNFPHGFNYFDNKRRLCQEGRFPDKTLKDFSKVNCSFKRSSECFGYDVTLVDIPGERFDDIDLWRAGSYEEWSRGQLELWKSTSLMSECMSEYLKLLDTHGGATKDELTWSYKLGMRNMLVAFVNHISPSTLFLADNELCNEEDVENDDWLRQRAIWRDNDVQRDFLPLPEDWKERHKSVYLECRKNFDLYRKKVLKPLFDEVMSCDSYIICLDVLNILVMGPQYYTRTRELLNAFYEKILPGRLEQLWRAMTFSPLRIAFAATKSDMVKGDNLNNMMSLLKDLTKNCDNDKVKSRNFTCCAYKSTWEEQGRLAMNYTDGVAHPLVVPKGNDWGEPKLPAIWPTYWNGEDYLCYDVSKAKPLRPMAKPPVADGLAEVFAFTLGVSK